MPRPRHPTADDVQANLTLCEHEVARLRAEVACLQASNKALEIRLCELQRMVEVLEAQLPNGEH